MSLVMWIEDEHRHLARLHAEVAYQVRDQGRAHRGGREDAREAFLPPQGRIVGRVTPVDRIVEARHVARGEARRVPPIGDQIDVGQSEAAQIEARLDRAHREDVGSVLVAEQPLLLDVGDDLPIDHDGRGGIDAVEVAQNAHELGDIFAI